MASVTYPQSSFNAGELSPRMHGRTDSEKYAAGLQTCENAIVLPHGGITRRPGFEYIHEVKDSSKLVELVPFEFSEDQAYVLEFGEQYMRVYMDGGIVVTPDSYTKLLLHCDGDDGSISFIDDGVTIHTMTAVGNAQVDTAAYAFSTGSLLLDGTGDYLQIPDHADWNFGAGAWTMDTWVRLANLTQFHTIWSQQDTTTEDIIWWYIDPISGKMVFRVVDSGALVIHLEGDFAFAANTWYHVAVVSDGSSYTKMYVQGVLKATGSNVTMPNHDQQVLIGYIDADTVFRDLSPDAKVITRAGDTTRSTTQKKFGGASIYFDGTGDNLNLADSADWDVCSTANANTCLEFWMRPTGAWTGRSAVMQYVDANNFWGVFCTATSKLSWYIYVASSYRLVFQTANVLTVDTWYHIRVQKVGNNYGMWINGNMMGWGMTATDTTLAGTFYVGTGVTANFLGYLDDIHVTFSNGDSLAPEKPTLDSSASARGQFTPYSTTNGQGAPTYDGYFSGGWQFDGADDAIYYADHNDWNLFTNTNDWTVSFFVRHTDHAGTETYFSQLTDANNYYHVFHLHGTGIGFYLYTGSTVRTRQFGNEIEDTNWHHVAIRAYNGYYGLWLDGYQTAYGYTATNLNATGAMFIGQVNATNWFDGTIDEFHWNHADHFTIDPRKVVLDSSGAAHGYASVQNDPNHVSYSALVGDYAMGVSGLVTNASGYLYYSDHADWDLFNQTNSTIDFWVKLNAHAAVNGLIQHYQANNINWEIYNSHGYGLVLYVQNAGAILATGYNPVLGEITDSNWHHVAVVQKGDHYGVYRDGNLIGYDYRAINQGFTGNLYIGVIVDGAGANQYTNGYLDEVRLTHANDFSASPELFYSDSSPAAKGAATTTLSFTTKPYPDTVNYKWGNGSANFDGTDDYFSLADHADWDIGSQTNFTLDFWCRMDTHAAQFNVIGQYVDGSNYWNFLHLHGSGWRLNIYVAAAAVAQTPYGGEITDSNWHHIALVKVGSDWGIYKDGVQVSYLSDAASSHSFAAALTIGVVNANYFDGNIDELRLSHTNAFTAAPNVGLSDIIIVPTAAYSDADANNKLLMHFNVPTITVPADNHVSDANCKLLLHFDCDLLSIPLVQPAGDANSKLLLHFDQDQFAVPTEYTAPLATTKLLVQGQRTPFAGHIDELRVSNGVARWSTAFTPPSQEYPAGGGSVIYELATPYYEEDVADLRVVQSTDTLFIAHPDYNVRRLERSDHDAWAISEIDWDEPAWNDQNTTAITLDPAALTGTGIAVVASAPYFSSNTVGAYFYMSDGFFRITSVSDSVNAVCDIKDDLTSHAATTAWKRGRWDTEQGYPSCLMFHEDRLCLSGVAEHPLTVFLSKVGDYEDFSVTSPTPADDDGMTVSIWSQQQNDIQWLASGKRMFIGAAGAEFWMSGATIDTPLAPDSVQAKAETRIGGENIAPVMIDNAVVFVQDGGERLRLWSYQLQSDGFESADLSLLSEHFTNGNPMYKIQYAQFPHSVIWCTTYDGTLLGLTLIKEHQVVAWHEHYTGVSDSIESIAVIPGPDGDELWAVVARSIGASTKRYVERMHHDFFGETIANAFFVDSGLSYSGAPAAAFSGLDHLEGKTIQVLADGVYVGEKTVTAGAFSITTPASVVHAGLPYNTNWQTLPWNLAGKEGSTDSTKKRIVNVMLKLYETSDIKIGKDSSSLIDVPMTDGAMYTDWYRREFNGDWGLNPTIFIRQDKPLPVTLLSIIADIELGGK